MEIAAASLEPYPPDAPDYDWNDPVTRHEYQRDPLLVDCIVSEYHEWDLFRGDGYEYLECPIVCMHCRMVVHGD